MTEGPREAFDPDELLRRAEAVAGAAGEFGEVPSVDEIRRIIHDLSVHQFELEMQNDELRRVQVELDKTQARYQDLFDRAPIAYIVFDARGRLLSGNLAAAELLGLPVATLPGILFSNFIDRADQDTFYRRRRALFRDADAQTFDLRLRSAGATPVTVRVDATVSVHQAGAPVGRAALTDITKRKQAEDEVRQLNETLEERVAARTAELEAANRDLETFSYSVSHDLRAPLRAINGFAEILSRRYRDSLDEQGRHYVDMIAASALGMGILIEELIDYSRLGHAAVRAQPVPLGPLVNELRSTFAERIEEAGVTFEVVEPLAVPVGDPVLLERILANLVDNALTYRRPEVTPHVTLRAIAQDATVTLAVTDNGLGIAPEYHERIFEVFARLHSQDEYEGTGIGLAIGRKAARLMDSDLTVESTTGEGSTFSLELPGAGEQAPKGSNKP